MTTPAHDGRRAPRPPRLAESILRRTLDPVDREPVLGDLFEEYSATARRRGRMRANLWYWAQLLRVLGTGFAHGGAAAATWGASALHEVRLAARALSRRRTLSAVAVGTLGLAIGAATSLYSVVDSVLLRPLPYAHGDRLVMVWNTYDSWRGRPILDAYWDHIALSWPEFLEWSAGATTFEDEAVYATWHATLTGVGDAAVLSVGFASSHLLGVLGARPALGRFFRDDEVGTGAPHVAVLSHELWSARFGADPTVVGRSVTLDGLLFEVVGVLPPGLDIRALDAPPGSGGHAVWIPVGAYGDDLLDRGQHSYEAVGRLARDATLEAATAEATPVLAVNGSPTFPRGARLAFRKDEEVGAARRPLLVLLGAVGLLLLIACANVAGLLLAEASGRRAELATRAALGAGVARITRQLLTEGILLGSAAAAVGVLTAYLGVGSLLALAPDDLPLPDAAGLQPRALVVALLLGAAAGTVLGLLPGVAAAGRDLAASLRGSGGGATRKGTRLQRAVVATQLAVSLTLLVCAGLVVRSLRRTLDVDPGFRPDDLVAARVTLPAPGYPDPTSAGAFLHDLSTRLESTPGIRGVSGVSPLPFSGRDASSSFQIVGREPGEGEKSPEANRRIVLPGYHRLLEIPLLAGRHLRASDRTYEVPVIVISRSMADTYWPEGDALGARIRRDNRDFEIVGIVGDVLHQALTGEAQATFYVPLDVAEVRNAMTLVVRSALPTEETTARIREAVSTLDADVPLEQVATLPSLLAQSTRPQRFRSMLMTAFALAATILASLGLFGSTARLAAARRTELGIRLALGARRSGLLGLVVLRETPVLLVGLCLGLAGASVAAFQVRSFLFEVSPDDPATWGAATLGLLAVGLASTTWAARRVLELDPVETMRAE